MKQPLFSQRHIDAIAQAISELHPGTASFSISQWRLTKQKFADMLERRQPSNMFDRGKFEEDCEP